MRTLIIAAALGVLSLPAFAQQSPGTGTNAGGPGRVGIPGQIGGGVPGTQPNNLERRQVQSRRMTKTRKMARRRTM